LAFFFGTDDIAFESTSEGTGGTRSFSSLTQAGDEGGLSRLYGGIHWCFDITAGNGMGRALARYVAANFLLPLGGARGPGVSSQPILPGDAPTVAAVLGDAPRSWPPIQTLPLPAAGVTRSSLDRERLLVSSLGRQDATSRPEYWAATDPSSPRAT